MSKFSQPDLDLRLACERLDPGAALDAIRAGAIVNPPIDPHGGDLAPLPIKVLLAEGHSQDDLAKRTELIQILFDQGAHLNLQFLYDHDIGMQSGLEIGFDCAMTRCGRYDWNEKAEIALIDAWLRAGNWPDPQTGSDEHSRPFLNSLGQMAMDTPRPGPSMHDEEGTDGFEWRAELSFILSTVALMGYYGCPVHATRLKAARFGDDDIETIGRRLAYLETQRMEQKTQAARHEGARAKRL